MKIEQQILDDHQAKLTVEVEADRLEDMKHRAASKIARRVKIPGFRPGKAPYPVIVRTVGDAAIFEEALELLVDAIYPEVIKESEIKPYGPGQLEGVPNLDPLTLEFIVPLDAEVTLGEYKSIRKSYEPEPVSESAVEEAIESLRNQQAIVEPVDRAAQVGDVITVFLNGEIIKDEGSEPLVRERSYPLVIEEADEDEWPFVGFSVNFVGKSEGDQGTIDYYFPEDYSEEHLRGENGRFHYKVENVKSRTLPALNDDFASSVGEFQNLEALRENIRSSLERQLRENYNEDYDEEVIDLALEQAEFKYPVQMLDEEIEQVKQDLIRRLERQGLDLDIYLISREMDEEALKAELTPVAEQRLERGLLLFEIGKVEDIQVEREELEQEAGSTLNYLRQVLPQNEARRLKNQDFQSNLVNNVLVDLLTRKTIERLRDIASGRLDIQAEQASEIAAPETKDTPADVSFDPEPADSSPVESEANEQPEQKLEEPASSEDA